MSRNQNQGKYARSIEATARRALRAQAAIARGDAYGAALIALGGPIRQRPINRAAVEACREPDSADPDYAVPTGCFIREWLEENGVSQAELARRLSVPEKHVSQVLNGAATLSHELAIKLESVTSISARVWGNLESQYRTDLAAALALAGPLDTMPQTA